MGSLARFKVLRAATVALAWGERSTATTIVLTLVASLLVMLGWLGWYG